MSPGEDVELKPRSIREVLDTVIAEGEPAGHAPDFCVPAIVISRNTQRRFVFLDVTDGRDTVQIAISRETFQDLGITAEDLALFDRVEIVGSVGRGFGRDGTKPTIVAKSIKVTIKHGAFNYDEADHRTVVSPAIELAGIRNKMADRLFRADNFIEYEARLFTISRINPDLEPLQAVVLGRGSPLFLEVSPLPQLIYASIVGGYTRLFACSRIFSRAQRDGFTSMESPVVTGVALFYTRDGIARDALVSRLVAGVATWLYEQTKDPAYRDYSTDERDWSPEMVGLDVPSVQSLTLIRRKIIPSGLEGQNAYSATDTMELVVPLGFAVCEGHTGTIAGQIMYLAFSVHIERVKRVLSEYEAWRVRARRTAER